jgi:hypothetical protein
MGRQVRLQCESCPPHGELTASADLISRAELDDRGDYHATTGDGPTSTESALGGELAAPRLENPITLSNNHHASLVTATGQFRAQSRLQHQHPIWHD